MQRRGQRADCKSGLNYTPSASSSLREFRIGSCEKPPVAQTTKAKVLPEDLVAPSGTNGGAGSAETLSCVLTRRRVVQEGKS